MAEITAASLAKQKYVPQTIPKPAVSLAEKEKKAAEKILQGMNPARAVKEAGFNFSPIQAEKYGNQLRARYNDRLVAAYESSGITPEYLAEKQMEILDSDSTKPADKLKAIDQILNVAGGYAPKQVEQTTVTFEQAVINIANTVNLSQLSADDVRGLLDVTDADIITE